ncbi:terminase small subunit [Azotobacter sp. CWF10]
MATQAEVAAHLDMTDRHLRRLIQQGVIPNGKGHGGIDIDAARIAYIRYQRSLCDGSAKPDMPDPPEEEDDSVERQLTQERLRLTAAQAEAQELKNEVTKKRLIPADFITFAFAKFIPAAGSIFDTVVATLRRRHPDLTPGQLDSISRELTKARNTIAQAADRLPEWHEKFIDSAD